ncbi:RagB/SusD family nutrient uptake outer membrane protein [Dyadobacter sp. CY22]|nr:RagB/SusD family nutrient uptake outer membrane protein [Dyadobacter chenhuakuii]MCF2492894.1 RagB/SusD family nutrient uptake outer membrane protein [Dyadobacter chenhuakuii]
MMKKQILSLGTLACLTLAGCDNSLDNVKNQSSYNDDTYFTTPATISEAVTATYGLLLYKGLYSRDFYYLMDLTGNEAEADAPLLGDVLQLHDYSYAPNHAQINDLWSTTYKMTFRANLVIDKAAKITPANDAEKLKLAQYVSEAYFLKAYAEFLLVTLWGRVPIRKDYSGNDEFYLPRASTEESWKMVESDLTNAISGLPVTYASAGDLGRVTKGAAIALLGKTYLYQKKYAEAAAQFELLTKAPYTYDLVKNLDELFTKSPVKNAESVFDVPHKEWGGWAEGSPYYMFGSQEGSGSGKNTLTGRAMEYGWNDWRNVFISDAAVKAFTYKDEAGKAYVDPRAQNTFYGDKASGGDVTYCDKCAAGVKTYPFAENGNGYRWRKYEPYEYKEKGELPQSDINSQIIRYADVLLMLAEAQIQVGKIGEALPLINKVRARSGAFAYTALGSKDEAMKKLMLERQLELVGEQVRWFDLIRWGIAKETLNAEKKAKYPASSQSFFQDKHVLFPIPLTEKNTNPLVAKDITNDWN